MPPAVRRVARREVVTRLRDRTFLIPTVLLALIAIALGTLAGSRDDGPRAYDVATVGGGAGDPVADALRAFRGHGVALRVREVSDRAEGERLLADGGADVLLDGDATIVQNDIPAALDVAVAGARDCARSADPAGCANAGGGPVAVRNGQARADRVQRTLGYLAIVLMYGLLFGFGFLIAGGVVEERSAGLPEVLASSARPSSLMFGKVLGIGLLGLAQLVAVSVAGLAAATAAGSLPDAPRAWQLAGVVVVSYVLGTALYGCVLAAAASLVSRQEDLQVVTTPVSLSLLGSFAVGFSELAGHVSGVHWLGALPPVAPFSLPARAAHGHLGVGAFLAIVALAVATAAVVAVLAARIATGAVLQRGGRTGVADAWRAGAPARSAGQ